MHIIPVLNAYKLCHTDPHSQACSHLQRCAPLSLFQSWTWHLQIQDRLEIIQLALDTHATAYKDAAQLAMLTEQLGLSERHADVAIRQARAACRAGDLAAAHELALQLARQDHAGAWGLAAEVILSLHLFRAQSDDNSHERVSAQRIRQLASLN